MAIEVAELVSSRVTETGYGARPYAELHYMCNGAADENEARDAITSEAPTLYDLFGVGLFFLPRSRSVIQPVDDLVWEGIIRYEVTPQTNQSEYTFDTRGGMQHITHALEHIASYAPAGMTAPDHKGAIGVTSNGVEGVDIPVPNFHRTETHYIPDELITDAYLGYLHSLTGTVNYAAFKGFASGECLFLGAFGAKRGCGDWAVSFEFASSPNRTGLVVGDITGISKKGWEYMWVEYEDGVDESAKSPIKVPRAVHIEQVFYYGDFSLLGIGT